ncbi:ABC transporter ATP-binding protein [Roseospira marina]|uniref:ABC transporter ATP-binding protein n=1 Tax=Roseospira marina TaxID=140057 RepID=A0A5M6IFR4_9PROT|nr:ABC transporter ATP-binding protein [Roseospira marina]KAA5606589.1 ABC transporter ATP-binding protein [Roseospira marina]MBB4314014.1 branched-chain amino acid transport system ATP-binding protein [Roseospira marina]MBB5087176.1 branched-chain amino acid transport system ATP-binding protein [Roseospira marina]
MSLLRVEGLGIHFGGVQAIEDLDFTIEAGTIHSIIGPNGAGKTTLFNLITGVYRPSAGTILLDDTPIAGRKPHDLARMGLSRTFQNLRIMMNMSALDNVMVGRHLHLNRNLLACLLRLPPVTRGDRAARKLCTELMDLVGLSAYRDADAGSLPYGALKRLEIARALAAEPRLLLLDEPAAGLNAQETREIDEVIVKVARSGVTVVLVEHDMKLVMGLSDHILVLDHGRTLAEGTPEAVRNNPAVVAAYLGTV